MLLTLTMLTALTQAAMAGPVVTAYDSSNATTVIMSAANGSGRKVVACAGDLTYAGTPRFWLHLEASGANPDGSPHYELVAFDEDCTLGTPLTNDGMKKYGTARWSQDGKKVAFSAATFDAASGVVIEQGIYVADVTFNAEGRPVGLANTRLAVRSLPWDTIFAWANDNVRITYSIDVGGQYDVFVANLDSGVATNVGNSPGTSEYYPTFAQNSDKIAFTRQTTTKGNVRSDLFTMAANGSGIFQVTEKSNTSSTSNLHPAWSPDGKDLAFSGMVLSTTTRDIFRIPSAGGRVKTTNLTSDNGGNFFIPAWRK